MTTSRRRVLLLAAAVAIASVLQASAGAAPLRILFIGNSYTYFNNLPEVVEQLAAARHRPVETKMVAPGGWRPADHWEKGDARAALAGGQWDVVGAARSGALTIAGSTLTTNRATTPPLPPTTLNLSRDLVALGIAATNMVPNQPALDAGPLFVAGVNYAKSNGILTVIADPGAYYFLSLTEINAHFALRNIDGMTIDLHGADLIFTHPLYYGMIVYYSTNAVVQNFTADYEPLPFTQVRVVSVDTANAQLQYAVQPGWVDPGSFNINDRPAGSGPPLAGVYVFRNGQPAVGVRWMLAQLPVTGGRLSLLAASDQLPLGGIRPGDIAVVGLRSFAEPVGTNHCNNCTIRSVTLYSSVSGGFQAITSPGTVMERVYSIPKPGTDRLVSTLGLSIFPVSGPNNTIRLSRAIRTMDDGIVFGGQIVGTVQSQVTSRRLIVDGSGGPSVLGGSDTVPNGTPVNFQRLSDGAMLGPAVIVSQSVVSSTPYQIAFDFDRDLPGGLLGNVMYSTDANQDGAGSVLERSTVQNTSPCCKGIYINGLASSTVRGNYVRRSAFAGLFLVDSMAPGDPPTSPLTNLNVVNNVIDGTNMSSNWWWFEFGAIQSVTLTTAYDLMTGQPFSNLNVTNNFIADSGRSGVWLGNTNGGSVSGNYLLNPNQRPDLANTYGPRTADATRPLVVDTTSTGVTTSNNVVDTTSGRVLVTDTQYQELAAYAPGATVRLNAYNVGALASPAAMLTDADGVTRPMVMQNTSAQALDVQLPPGAALGGAYITLTAGGAKYFGTLFVDSQDNIPAVNGCTYQPSLSSTTVPAAGGNLSMLVVTQAGCAYQATDPDPFVTGASGTGTGVISVGFAVNTGIAARTTTIEIAGQPFTVTQALGIPPSITAGPQSQTVQSGHTATLSVTATGTDLTYQWYLGASGTTTSPINGATGSSYTTPALTSTTSYWVRASNPYGVPANSNTATIEVVSYQPFTDNALVAGSSVIRAVHITELRTRIDALRVRFALAPYAWVDPVITPGVTSPKAQHILDLRAALSEVYVKAALTPPAFTDPSLVGVLVKLAHIAELRAAVIAIE